MQAMWTPFSRKMQIFLLAALWLILGFSYMARTRDFVRTHDFKSQLIYTGTIAFLKRLPTPKECWESGQPPLYYGIASVMAPGQPLHPFLIRTMSLCMGVIAVLLILFFLLELKFPTSAAFLTTLFVTTTPQFIFVFSTYNNDSLSTLLAILVINLSGLAIKAPSRWALAGLFIAACAGVYTKATVLNVLLILSVITTGAWRAGLLSWPQASRLLIPYGAAMVLYLPWVLYCEHEMEGTLFGFIDAIRGLPIEALRLPNGPWHTIFSLPGLHGEWETPFTAMWEMSRTKKSSLLSYLFATSLFGEFTFTRPSLGVLWCIVGLHGSLSMAAIGISWKEWRTRIALALIGLATASFAIYLVPIPMASSMDFRYVTWSWIAWAVLYCGLWQHLSEGKSLLGRWLVPGAMAVGIVLHAYFLLTAQSLT